MKAIKHKEITEVVPMPSYPRFNDLTGMQFGEWTVVAYAGQTPETRWWCKCSCDGQFTLVLAGALRSGHSRSCGCTAAGRVAAMNRTHGQSHTSIYNIFLKARKRCTNINDPAYPDYGGRGIEFRFESFEDFAATMGERPSLQHTLDRVDNDGHYEPSNVRWATHTEQQNNRRWSIRLDAQGLSLSPEQWSAQAGVPVSRIYGRRSKKYCDECAIFAPVRARCLHKSEVFA